MPRRLLAIASLFFAALAGAPAAEVEPRLDTLLAGQDPADAEGLRAWLTQGELPGIVAGLMARTESASARRFALIEWTESGTAVATLLVDDGVHPGVYECAVGERDIMGLNAGRFLRETTPAGFEATWRTLQEHAAHASRASDPPLPSDRKPVGVVVLHAPDGDRRFLLLQQDLSTVHHTTFMQDLVGNTLLAGLHYRSGLVRAQGWLTTLLLGLPALPASERQKRNEALWAAAIKDDWDAVKSLRDAGADIDARDSAGRTLLERAGTRGDTEAIEHLRALGAKPGVANFFE